MSIDESVKEVVEEAVTDDATDGGDVEVTVVNESDDSGSATEEVAAGLEVAEQVRDIAEDEAAAAGQAALDTALALTPSFEDVRQIAREEASAAVAAFAGSLSQAAEEEGVPVIEEIVEEASAPENDTPPKTQSRWYRPLWGGGN